MTDVGAVRAAWRDYGNEDLSPLLRAALDAFVELGYHGTTVRIIASKASMSVPGLYYHYESKQDILAALLRVSMDELLGRSEGAVADTPDEPRLQFTAQVENAVLFMTRRRGLRLLASRDVRSLDEPARSVHAARRDELEDRLEGIIRAGHEAGEFLVESPAAAARAVLDMCRGVADWYRPDGQASPEELAVRYSRFALHIVRAR